MLRVVSGVSLVAERGQVTALLGANGAGKTTTIECAQGLQKRTGGSISLLGQDPDTAGAELRSRVGVMLQDGGLPPSARPIPLLRHIAGMYRDPWPVEELVAAPGHRQPSAGPPSGASPAARSSGWPLPQPWSGNPEVLFLDEPSAGLDPQSRQLVFELISELRDRGMGIVLTTHLMDDAQRLADYVYIIDAGRNVAEGTVAQLLQHEHRPRDAAQEHVRTLLFEAGRAWTSPACCPPPSTSGRRGPGSYAATGALTPAGPGRADSLVGSPRHHAGLA